VTQTMTIDDAPLNSFHLRVVAYTTVGYILGMIGIALAVLTDPDYEPALAM
jgi:sulfite exporter TauE/SafE